MFQHKQTKQLPQVLNVGHLSAAAEETNTILT